MKEKTGTKEIISYSYQTEKKKCLILYVKLDNVIVVYNGANPFELGFINDYKQIKGASAAALDIAA